MLGLESKIAYMGIPLPREVGWTPVTFRARVIVHFSEFADSLLSVLSYAWESANFNAIKLEFHLGMERNRKAYFCVLGGLADAVFVLE